MRAAIKLMLSIMLLSVSSYLIADEQQDYAKQIREEVWNWDKPEFKNYEVPEQYKNESAVILARHQEIEVRARRIVLLLRLYYTEIDRKMVKINDNVSLEKFSDFSFYEKVKFSSMTYGQKNLLKTVVGVRIIKPDGTLIEVDTDDAVLVKEDKKGKETQKKLAIPGLQIGDVIDYFICENMTLDEYNPPPIWFALYSMYPTLSHSARCLVNTKHLSVEYAVMNGAKDFIRTPMSEEETVLELKETNLPKVEEGRWISYLRDTPIIRMHVLNNKNAMVGSTSNARKPGIYKIGDNLTENDLISDAKTRSVNSSYYKDGSKPYFKDLKKYLKSYFNANPDLSDIEKADYIREYIHLEWPLNVRFYNSYTFMCIFHHLLMEFEVPHDYLLMTDKYGPRMQNILASRDLDDAIRVENNYYTYPFGMRLAGTVYANNQGQEAYIVDKWTLQNGKVKPDKSFKGEYIVTPISKAEENKSLQRSEVTFSENNPLELIIDRQVSRSGSLKAYYQNLFTSRKMWDETLRKHLSVIETYEEALKRRYGQKDAEDLKVSHNKKIESIKDSAKVEIVGFHDLEPKEVLNYEIKSLGALPADPNFVYTTKYTIEGLVKKAGNNWILDAGKLIGTQFELKDENRERIVNAYLPTAQMLEHEVIIHIPDGYEAQEIEKMTVSVDNEYGSFRSSATVEGNTLKITTQKQYKQAFVPVAGWPRMVEVIDQASNFNTLSIVLKKK